MRTIEASQKQKEKFVKGDKGFGFWHASIVHNKKKYLAWLVWLLTILLIRRGDASLGAS